MDRWFCVADLNTGLSEPAGAIDRSTPRATIESLLFLARKGDWDTAAHLLDLSDIESGVRAIEGPKLIRRLESIISRKAVVDWDRVVDRPDGIDAQQSTDTALAGQPRKSLLLWTISLDRSPASIRLNRIKPDGESAVWVFSRQTVGNIPALFELHGPGRLEALLPETLKRDAGLGFMWWELFGLPVILLISTGTAWLVWRFLSCLPSRKRAEGWVIDDILKATRGPAAIGAGTGLALVIASDLMVFSGQVTSVLTPVAWLGVMASGLWLVVNAAEAVLDRLIAFDEMDLTKRQEAHARVVATRISALRRAFIVGICLIGGGVFLSQTNIFQNLGLSLLGAAGALTLVLGFAARRVLGNVMSSLQIALNQSAQIGDRIVYNDYLCHVERIGFTYVQLRDWDGTRLVVPVEEFASTPFENWTMKDPAMLRIIKIKCAHDADVDRLRGAFNKVIEELEGEELGDIDDAVVRVADQDVFGKDVWFALPCIDPNTSWDLACKAREKLLAAGARIAEEHGEPVFPDVRPAEAA